MVKGRSRRAACGSADEDQDEEHGVHAAPGLGTDGEDTRLVGAHPALHTDAEQHDGDDDRRQQRPAEEEGDGGADGDEQAGSEGYDGAAAVYEPADERGTRGAEEAE